MRGIFSGSEVEDTEENAIGSIFVLCYGESVSFNRILNSSEPLSPLRSSPLKCIPGIRKCDPVLSIVERGTHRDTRSRLRLIALYSVQGSDVALDLTMRRSLTWFLD